MEKALVEAESRYRGIFDNAVVGIFQSLPEGYFLSVNPSMAAMFGYDSPGEMVSLITDIAHQFYADPMSRRKFMDHIAADGEVQNFECEALRKDGSRFWLSMSVRGIFEQESIIRYEGMCEDVTERKLLRE
jgi:PAS domain S-box-containing protein